MPSNSADSEEDPKTNWYALFTSHQHEKAVANSLSHRGFRIFLPLYDEVRQWSDRRKWIQVPLFPCYVFVQTCLERKLDVLVAPGVHGFVSFESQPAPIPPSEIEDLRRVVGLTSVEPHPFLHCGDWVRVKYGPFQGIEGILVRKKGLARLVLSVEMLQKSAAVEIDAVLTEKLPRPTVSQVQRFAAATRAHSSAAIL